MRLSTHTLARMSGRHPWKTLAAWIMLVVAGAALAATSLQGALTTDMRFTNHPESIRAEDLLVKLRGPARVTEYVVVRSSSLTVDDEVFAEFVLERSRAIRMLGPGIVQTTVDYYATHNRSLISADGHATLIAVVMAGSRADAHNHIEKLHAVTLDAAHPRGIEVLVAGEATLGRDFTAMSESDLRLGEALGVPVALIVLVLVFGTVVAALIPLLLAVVAIAVALGVVALLGREFEFVFFVINMITMMGLAVGIDYSLFVVSRYREERAHGLEKLDAIEAAGATASRAVLFSGATVVFALGGMLIIPTTVFRSLAAGAIIVVAVSVAVSLTLLPALLALLGDRVNALRLPLLGRRLRDEERRGGVWDRITGGVMRHPIVSVVLSAGLLLAAASSLFGLRTGFSGVSTLPSEVQSKRAFIALARDFSGGLAEPVSIVVNGRMTPEVRAGLDALRRELAQDPAFGPAGAIQTAPDGSVSLMPVPLRGDPNSEAAAGSVRRLRAREIPSAFASVNAEVLVGGQTAFGVDFLALTRGYQPIVFSFVLALSFVLLTVVFRSLVVAAKAIVMNLLSVGAAYGLVVLVFRHGVGAGVLGFQRVEVIEAWLPLFLFSILFGLSMDYHVFLLSRIRERYVHQGDNAEAVAFGVRSTAGIITGAALIMVAVFSGLAAGDLVMLQQMGFGLAVAVFLDATIVRSVLVPASMRLLGRANWWLPRWLQWIPEVRAESESVASRHPAP